MPAIDSCAGTSASLDVIEKVARLRELGPRTNRENRDCDRQVAAERDEPAGHEADREAPAGTDEEATPRQVEPVEIRSEQLQRKALRGVVEQRDQSRHRNEQRGRDTC